MEHPMTWDNATQLTEQIAMSPDAGNWHAQVMAVEQGYAVAMRQHNTHTFYFVSSLHEFRNLCDHLMRLGR